MVLTAHQLLPGSNRIKASTEGWLFASRQLKLYGAPMDQQSYQEDLCTPSMSCKEKDRGLQVAYGCMAAPQVQETFLGKMKRHEGGLESLG